MTKTSITVAARGTSAEFTVPEGGGLLVLEGGSVVRVPEEALGHVIGEAWNKDLEVRLVGPDEALGKPASAPHPTTYIVVEPQPRRRLRDRVMGVFLGKDQRLAPTTRRGGWMGA